MNIMIFTSTTLHLSVTSMYYTNVMSKSFKLCATDDSIFDWSPLTLTTTICTAKRVTAMTAPKPSFPCPRRRPDVSP